jgi:citrate lyase subunit alpha / citrate CoA-transferase
MNTLIEKVAEEESLLGKLQPFAGAYAETPYLADPEKKLHRKLCGSLEEAIKRSALQDGMTISFHHSDKGYASP